MRDDVIKLRPTWRTAAIAGLAVSRRRDKRIGT
jgi:hypothetical protein